MEFSIFYSILEGEIYPFCEKAQKRPHAFMDIKPELKNPQTIKEFENGLVDFPNDYPTFVTSEKFFFASNPKFRKIIKRKEEEGKIFEPEIEIVFPKPNNATTEFYYYLITNEGIRSFYIFKFLMMGIEMEEDRRVFLFHVLKKIRTLLKYNLFWYEINKNKTFFDLNCANESDFQCIMGNAEYVYKILTLSLIRLFYEISDTFSSLVGNNGKSVFELLGDGVKYLNPEEISQQITFGILRLRAKELVENENFDFGKAIDMLAELYKQKDFEVNQNKRNEVIAALENRCVLSTIDGDQGKKLRMEFIGSLSFTKTMWFEIKRDYDKKIEKHNTGYKRLKEVEEIISDFYLVFGCLLQNDPGLENSIPWKLLEWLNEQKELYRNQIDKNFGDSKNNGNNGKNKLPKNKSNEEISFECFTYLQFEDNPDKIDNLFSKLNEYYPEIGHRFISENTDKRNFRKIFSGSKKKIEKPIFWEGFENELKYFIELIHNDHKLVLGLKGKHHEVMAKCFVDKDGKKYDWRKFHSKNPPAKSAEIIERIVKKQLL